MRSPDFRLLEQGRFSPGKGKLKFATQIKKLLNRGDKQATDAGYCGATIFFATHRRIYNNIF